MALRAGGAAARLIRSPGAAGPVQGFRADGLARRGPHPTGLATIFRARAGNGAARLALVTSVTGQASGVLPLFGSAAAEVTGGGLAPI
jgi:hypothetical protein